MVTLIHPATPHNVADDGPVFINYSVNGQHFMVGPYKTRRFAYSHMDDVRRIAGVSNVYLGKDSGQNSHRRRLPITSIMAGAR